MKLLTLTLAADLVDAYADGDVLDVYLDGRKIANALDLRPGGAAFPETALPAIVVGTGIHVVATVVRDALGNATAAYETEVEVVTGPRSPADLAFASQAGGDGDITFGFTPSPDIDTIEGHVLYCGLTLETIDWETPVATADTPLAEITDATARPITDGTLVYALRAAYSGGAEDDADPPVHVVLTLAGGVVQLPKPLQIRLWQVEPIAGGAVRVVFVVNNIGAAVPVTAVRVYAGEDVPSFVAAVAEKAVDALAGGTYVVDIDPGLDDGDTAAVAIRAVSANDVEETNTDAKTCVVHSAAPPQFTGVTPSLS